MPIVPFNADPSKDYVTPGVVPPMTVDGLVYNKIYAHTGVVDSLQTQNGTLYYDPVTNTANATVVPSVFGTKQETQWISSQQFGGPTSTPVVLTYDLNNTIYYNNIVLDILNVPCFVELLDSNMIALPGASTFVINGGSDIYTTSDWMRLEYTAPYTLEEIKSINVRITRNKAVEVQNSTSVPTQIAYSVGVTNFGIKLNVQSMADIPSTVISGQESIVTQNRFGFVENYNYSSNPVSNVFTNDNAYWKSAPQPVGDAIVYFYTQVGTVTQSGSNYSITPNTINRIYIDPIYSGCNFNIYYSTQTDDMFDGNSPGDPDYWVWTPIQRDFTLKKGVYEIPEVTCTHLKFEFVKLVAEPYDLPFDYVDRVINVFPYEVEEYYTNLEQSSLNGDPYNYNRFSTYVGPSNPINTLTQSTIFGNLSQFGVNAYNWPDLSSLNATQYGNSTTVGITSQSSITDPTISYKLVASDGSYNGQDYNQFLQRRFPNSRTQTPGVDYYQITIRHNWHQAYFAGVQYITAFYERQYDDLRGTPQNFISTNGTNSGFVSQGPGYVSLLPDQYALTPWMPTLDSFSSFSIGALASDWRSFLPDSSVLMNDGNYISIYSNSSVVSNLGTSSIVEVVNNVPSSSQVNGYGLRSGNYTYAYNTASYTEANFITTSNWSAASGTTIANTAVDWVTEYSNVLASGTASGISVSGGNNTVIYTFTLPNIPPSGTTPWNLQLGSAAYGVVGYASYVPSGYGAGLNYYFLTTVQVSGNTSNKPVVNGTYSLHTQFVNASGVAISGTVVNGNTVTVTSGVAISGSNTNILTVTGTNYTANIPSNKIQVVISGSTPYDIFQFGNYQQPTSLWTSPRDLNRMRVSGTARILLPNTNIGTYRVSLFATDPLGNNDEIVFKQYSPGELPLRTWMDIEVNTYTGNNYTNFYVEILQTNASINETFYVSMLAPFYNPIRYEYITVSGASNWQPIITGINSPDAYISTVSGQPANGIQVRATALDNNVYICGLSVIPHYKQNIYYTDLNIDYIGPSKTNETSERVPVANKPYFMLNQETHPSRFTIDRVAGTVIPYAVD